MCPEVIAIDSVKNNSLIAPFGFTKDGSKYGLIYRNSTEMTPEEEVLRKWLYKEGKDLRNANKRRDKRD